MQLARFIILSLVAMGYILEMTERLDESPWASNKVVMSNYLIPEHSSSTRFWADTRDLLLLVTFVSELCYFSEIPLFGLYKWREGIAVLPRPAHNQLSAQSSRNVLFKMCSYDPELISVRDTPKRWHLKLCQSQNEITDRSFSAYHQWLLQD